MMKRSLALIMGCLCCSQLVAGTALARPVDERHELSAPQTYIDARRQQIDDLTHRANRALTGSLALRRSGLAGLQSRLGSLSPLATLERGYAVVRLRDTGMVIRSVDQVTSGDELAIRVQDGEFEAVTRSEP